MGKPKKSSPMVYDGCVDDADEVSTFSKESSRFFVLSFDQTLFAFLFSVGGRRVCVWGGGGGRLFL